MTYENMNKKINFWIILITIFGIGIIIFSVYFIMKNINNITPEPAQYVTVVPTPSPSPSPTPSPTPTPEPTPDPMEGLVYSPLNGLPILEGLEYLRPMAVVVNNHSRALPQSGISQAEIIYEVLAEGDITRLVAIFQQLEAEAIGPVRSTRDYFVDFALQHDAVLVHHGGSQGGYSRIRNSGIPSLDGMALEGITFWRDPERRRIPALLEHSSFTGAEKLEETISQRGIRRYLEGNETINFLFNQDEEIDFAEIAEFSGGTLQPALEITVPFSISYPRRFVFDQERQMYAVYNIHGPHIDALLLVDEEYEAEDSDAQIFVSNILVQHVRSRVIDNEGRREVTTIGSGTGYLATGGYILNVRWERDSGTSPTRWYFMNGEPIKLTPGKIWINVLQDSATIQITPEPAEHEEFEDYQQ